MMSLKRASFQAVKQQLRNLLRRRLEAIIEEYSVKTGFKPNGIAIRQQETKWGSCSSSKIVSLNLKLVCLPERMIKYIVHHEILHLKYKRHSEAFWQTISQEFPDYKQLEEKLTEYWFQTEKLFQNLRIEKR